MGSKSSNLSLQCLLLSGFSLTSSPSPPSSLSSWCFGHLAVPWTHRAYYSFRVLALCLSFSQCIISPNTFMSLLPQCDRSSPHDSEWIAKDAVVWLPGLFTWFRVLGAYMVWPVSICIFSLSTVNYWNVSLDRNESPWESKEVYSKINFLPLIVENC